MFKTTEKDKIRKLIAKEKVTIGDLLKKACSSEDSDETIFYFTKMRDRVDQCIELGEKLKEV